MKNKSISQSKSKSRSLNKTPSSGLIDYMGQKYPKNIPIAAITAAQKMYGKTKPLNKDDKILKRYADNKGNIDAPKLIQYLNKNETHEKGKPLNIDSINRVYQNFANEQGKLSFEYIMKMGESSGVVITPQIAKAIVKKYGKRKDYLDIQDCIRLNDRWSSRNGSKSPNRGKK